MNSIDLLLSTSSDSLSSLSTFFVQNCNNETIICSTWKIKLSQNERGHKWNWKAVGTVMHSCEIARDYCTKSDDFQLKFNNACNMLKIHLCHEAVGACTCMHRKLIGWKKEFLWNENSSLSNCFNPYKCSWTEIKKLNPQQMIYICCKPLGKREINLHKATLSWN